MTAKGVAWFVAFGVASGLATPAARADSTGALIAGLHAYNEGEMDRAELQLRRALKGLKRARDRGVAWLYVGLVHAARNQLDAARVAFRRALEEDPEAAPEPERTPPVVLAQLQAARREVTGVLEVRANEPARVRVDGVDRGVVPLRVPLPVGRHDVALTTPSGATLFESRGVLVHPRHVARVEARLPPPPREVAVAPTPPGVATVAVPAAPRWWQRRRPWGYVSLGLAGVTTAIAAGFGVSARTDLSALRAAIASGVLSRPQYDAQLGSIARRTDAANVLFAVAGAAALTGLVLVLVGDRDAPRVSVSPAGAGLLVGGRF